MRKKSSIKKRKRFEFLNVELSEKDIHPIANDVHVNIEMDFVNGTSKVINARTNEVFGNKSLVLGYIGENKKRITTEIETNSDDHNFCFNLKLNRYKHIIAIDTNSFTFKSEIVNREIKLGFGIALLLVEDEKGTSIIPINQPFVTSVNPEKPENENWVRVIELLRKECQCTDSRKVGIVVDSDLGNINDYNKRLKPIYGNYFLPEEYELIFASDKVKDNVFNWMISESHSMSKKYIPLLIKNLQDTESEVGNAKLKG